MTGRGSPPGGAAPRGPRGARGGDGATADGMSAGGDLSREAVADLMPDRPLRAYPAMMSTEAEALAWGRRGAPSGALVVAAYQASPRGRSGLERPGLIEPDRGLGFTLVVRPDLHPERQGWSYVAAGCAAADVLAADRPDEEVSLVWPDEVHVGGRLTAALGVHSELGPSSVRWAAVTVLVSGVVPPRTRLLARLVEAIESRHDAPTEEVLADYRERCGTLGRRVRARLLPLGPSGPEVTGVAVDVLADGALVVDPPDDRRVAVPPQDLGHLEDPDDAPRPPEAT